MEISLNTAQTMDRRRFLAGLGASGSTLLLPHAGAQASRREKPNIIFIMADDVSAKEYSIHGGKGIQTPVLDRMAREGVAFATAWAVPQCMPTRALLHTGNYACNTGWYGNAVQGADFSERDSIMGKMMQRCGYTTAWFEKFHFLGRQPDPRPFGFDEYAVAMPWQGHNGPPQDRRESMYQIQWFWHPGIVRNGTGIPAKPADFGPDLHADMIIDFMKRHRDEPFFVYWPTFLPHMDFNDKRWSYTDVPELDAAGSKTGRKIPGSLKSTLEYLDHLVGRVLDGLGKLGLAEETIVIFAGDNGTAPYGKNRFEDERGPHVPFLVWGPGRVKSRGMSDVLVDFSDVMPTLVELAGGNIPARARVDGHSFAPYLLGQPFEERETIFCQFYDGRWVRDKRYLLDARGVVWDCGKERNESSKAYKKLTQESDPQRLSEVMNRFRGVLESYPAPDTSRPEWRRYRKRHRPALLP